MGACDMCRVGARPDHDEIVPRDLPAVGSVPGGDEFLFGVRVMHENQIRVVACGRLQRLARSLGQDVHRDAGFLGESGEDVREQARILDRGCGREDDRLSSRLPGCDGCMA